MSSTTLSNQDHLLAFLMNYDVMAIYGTYPNLLKHIFESKLPIDLLTFKFFEFMLFKKKDIDEIYSYFKNTGENSGYEEIDSDRVDKDIESIVKILDLLAGKQVQFVGYDVKDYMQKVQCFKIPQEVIPNKKSNIVEYNVPHIGIPPPDPEKGRPHLGWRTCVYPNCGKVFKNGMDLVEHLIKCNVYTEGFHYYHEDAVTRLNFNPEKVHRGQITKCPSLACAHKDFGSPDALIDHLRYMGIPPFWEPGMIFETEENMKKKETPPEIKANYDVHYPKLFEVEQCLLCLDCPPQVVAGNCRHHIVCRECFVSMNIGYSAKVCPMCRGPVNVFYPFY